MKPSAPVCPVPSEQQPLNEFRDLAESWYFRWATLGLVSYLKPIVVLWGMSWLLSAPVAAVSFPAQKHPGQFVLCAAAGALVLPGLALVRLLLGWLYVRDRLLRETIFYEESGWYDGQTWTKPDEVVQRDRLIVTYQIKPILQRLLLTFAAFGGVLVLGASVWIVLFGF